MISFEIIEDRDKIKDVYPHWEKLYQSGGYEPSVSLEWFHALAKSHLEGFALSFILLKEEGELVGIVPVYIKEIKRSGFSLRTLFPVSEYFNTHSDLLLKNGSKELIEAFLKAIFSLKNRWDLFRINRFVATSPLLDRIADCLGNHSAFNYEIRSSEPSFFIPLGETYDDYLKTLSAKFRYKLKTVSKRIHSNGEIAFLGNQDFHDFIKAFEVITGVERNSWKHKNGTGITSTEKKLKFYGELWERAFNNGHLRLSILLLNAKPIAYECGLVEGQKYYSVHGSYDEKHKKENPGTILLDRFIEDLICDQIREFDFFGEPFEWQKYWTDQYRWHRSLLIYNNTLKARLFSVYNLLKNRRSSKKEDQIVLRDPRDIKGSKS